MWVKVCQRHLKFDFYAGVQKPKPPNDHPNEIFDFSDAILLLCLKKFDVGILVLDPINLDIGAISAQS